MAIKKKYKYLLGLILLLLLIIYLLGKAGPFLVREDNIQKSDALVLLMGSFPARVLHAADLYHGGYAPELIFCEESNAGLKLLLDKGIELKSSNQQCRYAAIKLGIPDDSIILLPGNATSTQMEALIIREYLSKQPEIDTLTIVSTPGHTRRAGMIFEKAMKSLDHKVVIYTSPSSYSNFTGEKWWKDREDIQVVVIEYLKIFNFLVFEQWEL